VRKPPLEFIELPQEKGNSTIVQINQIVAVYEDGKGSQVELTTKTRVKTTVSKEKLFGILVKKNCVKMSIAPTVELRDV